VTLIAAMILCHSASSFEPLNLKEIQPVGTVDASRGRLAFQWPSSGFLVRFSGSQLVADLEDSADGAPSLNGGTASNSVEVRVDGGPGKAVVLKPGRNRISLAEGLAEGLHIASVRKRTESHVGVITLFGLDAPGGIKNPPAKGRRLTVYGDSNSCGYGAEAASREIRYSPSTQNSEAAFPAITARALGLELNLIAASGWGVLRGYGGDKFHSVPSVWDRVFIEKPEPLATGQESAAVLVILGDNDFAQGDPGSEFESAYLSFVKQIRKKDPACPILLCTSSFMQGDGLKRKVGEAIDRVIAALGDSRISRFNLPAYQESWGYGADWHISLGGHRKVAEPLIARLEGMRVGRRVGSGA